MKKLNDFPEIWLVDFEFRAPSGCNPEPVCLVARELRSGRTIRLWQDQLKGSCPPYPVGEDALFIAYYASAELGCHLSLGWPMPYNIVDLYIEFRNHTNGVPTCAGDGLLGALAHFGLDTIRAEQKEEMRNLVLRGGPWSPPEKLEILNYCESDVIALERLWRRMEALIDVPRALFRGRYAIAAARMEHNGVPVDTEALGKLRANWPDIKQRLITEIDADYGVFDGTTFKRDRWERWLGDNNIPWPRLPSGALDLKDETFKDMGRIYPMVQPMRDLRHALGQLKLEDLAVGHDGRNRTLISMFRSRTGRNQPSNTRFIFGPSAWLRGLIKPPPGCGIAYCDFEQQEFAIAAALSGDEKMMEAYRSGDPYLFFAKQAGAVPPDATKENARVERELFKACTLAVQYGMGPESLARNIKQSTAQARLLLEQHHETYRKFWGWSDAVVDHAMLYGKIWTVYGWYVHTVVDPNPRMLRNFAVQANGAEMLRLACCLATERGIKVCAPVHDALLIEAPLPELDDVVLETQRAMREASEYVLDGFPLRTEAKIVRYPERYSDPRGQEMWNLIWQILGEDPDAVNFGKEVS